MKVLTKMLITLISWELSFLCFSLLMENKNLKMFYVINLMFGTILFFFLGMMIYNDELIDYFKSDIKKGETNGKSKRL